MGQHLSIELESIILILLHLVGPDLGHLTSIQTNKTNLLAYKCVRCSIESRLLAPPPGIGPHRPPYNTFSHTNRCRVAPIGGHNRVSHPCHISLGFRFQRCLKGRVYLLLKTLPNLLQLQHSTKDLQQKK